VKNMGCLKPPFDAVKIAVEERILRKTRACADESNLYKGRPVSK
jgi:hypothetical protein